MNLFERQFVKVAAEHNEHAALSGRRHSGRRGALHGFGIGSLLGAGIGAAQQRAALRELGIAMAPAVRRGATLLGAGMGAAGGGLWGGGIGGLVGLYRKQRQEKQLGRADSGTQT